MLQWGTLAAAARDSKGRFLRGGFHRTDDWWPGRLRWYLPLLAAGRTVRNLQPQTPHGEVDALAERYFNPRIAGWERLSVSQQLDLIATKMLADDRMDRLGNGNVGGDDARRDYLSASQAYMRGQREKPFEDMDGVIDFMRANHRRWSDDWFRTYGDPDQFAVPGMPCRGATVFR